MANRFLSNIRINDAYTFPASDGSADQVIATDGAGNLSFQSLADIAGTPEANFVYYNVKNSSGSTIAKGAGVMAVGADGNSGHILIDEMVADGSVEPKFFLGILETELNNGSTGRVVHFGELDHINTNAFETGDVLWCDPANPGGFTVTEPLAPNVKIAPAFVIFSGTNGKLKVRVQGNEGLHELHDVRITSQADKDLLVWNDTGGYWENSKTIGDITTGNITTAGTVDGVDVSAFKSDYDTHTHDDRYYTETEIDTFLTNSANWDTAYSWGDHGLEGYLTTETDPIFTASAAGSITSTDVSNWNEVYNEYAGLPEILIYRDNFTGNSSTVDFTMAQNADDEVTVQVYFDGIYQSKDNYSVVDDVITFSTAPPSGVSIEVITLTKFSASAGYLTSSSVLNDLSNVSGTPTDGQVLTYDTINGWQPEDAAGGDYVTSYIGVDTTATAGNLYVFTATLTLTLPASPTAGDKVAISNMSGTTTPVIARNGNLIAGLAEDFTVDVANIGLQFIYSGATKGWILI